MIRSALFAVVLALAIPLHAQEKPDAPKPNRRVFVVGTSLLAASSVADAITTRQNLDRGAFEYNPLFGRYPSPAKQAGINAGIFAAEVGLFYLTERNRHTWVRWVGRALVAQDVTEHTYMAACNAQRTLACHWIEF